MAVSGPIFTELKPARQLLLNNSYTAYHEKPTKGLVTDTKPQTGGKM